MAAEAAQIELVERAAIHIDGEWQSIGGSTHSLRSPHRPDRAASF
jgi:hypothetical protein